MIRSILRTIRKQFNVGYTTQLLLIILLIIVTGFFATEKAVRGIISKELLQEKQVMLFGLATQLDNALAGTYNDILAEHEALTLPRVDKIAVLHSELKQITDFVASGTPGVGVGYYSRELDAIITYGPDSQFNYTIGQPIFEGHLGYQVMAEGKRIVQQGELVRGKILNCMHPIIRNNVVIGYIWANETLADVSSQLSIVFNQILIFTVIIFILLYVAVMVPTWYFNRRIDQLIKNIDMVMINPTERLPKLSGSLDSVVRGVNSLLDKVFYFKSHNEFIFDSLKSGILAVTMEGEILLANPAFLTMLNLENENIIGRKAAGILPGELIQNISDYLSGSDRGNDEDFIFEGSIYEFSCNEVYNDKNEEIGLVFILRDRTLLRLYERRLQQQQRLAAVGEIGLTIAHEIKNPLTAVKGFSQLLNRRVPEDDKSGDYLRLMDDELNRIDKLLNELLVNGGRAGLKPESVDFESMINEFMIIYSNSYPDIDFKLQSRCTSTPFVKIDKNRIAQLVDNLVKNSVEAIHAKADLSEKSIDMYLEINTDKVELRIRDNGIGIPEENLSRIMTPFFTTKRDGTGLGLGLCLGIVEKHQGKLNIESVPDEYTEISVYFEKKKLELLNES